MQWHIGSSRSVATSVENRSIVNRETIVVTLRDQPAFALPLCACPLCGSSR
jgi:hypothetical protein